MSASKTQILKRRIAALAVAAVAATAILAATSSASQPTTVHSYVAKNGTTVVSGYDGGVALTKSAP
jgi:hypothetical protein